MRYIRLEVKGCCRLAYGSIDKLIYTPEQKIQLILGTNGSGKSSLVNELTPLPPSPRDYTKDGYKEVEIENNGSHYLLRTIFQPSVKHSFIKDGVELNEGHTATVQKMLAFQEFGITNDIHALLTDQTHFHSMGPSERRQWFTRLSDINFNYALGVYQKLKDNLRDNQGAIKRYQERAVQEANKLLKPEEIELLKKEITFLQDWLHQLIEHKPSNFVNWDNLDRTFKAQQSKLEELSQQAFKHWHHCKNSENFKNIGDLQEAITALNVTLQVNQKRSEELGRGIEAQQKTLNTLEKANVTSLAEIDQRVKEYETKIQESLKSIRIPLEFQDPFAALQSLLTVNDSLQEVFVNLPEDTERNYTRDKYEALAKQDDEYNKKLVWCQETLTKLNADRKAQEALKTVPAIECPNCHHSWHQGFNSRLYEEILNNIKVLSEKQERFTQEQKTLKEKIAKAQEYISYFRVFSDVVRQWKSLSPLWEYLMQTNLIREKPQQVLNVLMTVTGDLKIHLKVQEYREEIQKLQEAKKVATSSATGQIETLRKDLVLQENQFIETNEMIRQTQFQLQQLKARLSTVAEMQNLEGEIEQQLSNHEAELKNFTIFYQREAFNKVIQAISLELSLKESLLSKVHIQQAVVNDIERELAKLKTQAEATAVLIKELSPTEGLIAKGLMNFINGFVEAMNDFIREVWLYPLEIIPLEPSSDDDIDLNYRFKINVQDNGRPVDDIDQGSEAMKEIIDLAFKLVSMDCLHMSDYPISLDEFARSFDTGHRQSAFNAINKLIQNSDHSQIFIISHYTECYGSLVNADINVLCQDNLYLPEDTTFNRTLKLE